MNKIIFIFIFALLIFSCKKKEVGPQFEKGSQLNGYKILILNEGNFGFGNASVSAYNPYTKEIANNNFNTQNGILLGDVLQSAIHNKGKYYFVLNNSRKIVISDTTNFTYINEITGFNSPRYVVIKNGKGYVTDLKQGAVYVVDLATNQIIKQIKTNGWTEKMILNGDGLYVIDKGDYLNNQGNNRIYKINTSTNQLVDSTFVPKDPNSMVLDKNGKLWVLCSGGINDALPKLIKINLQNNTIESTFTFLSINESPTKLCINKEGDRLYFLNNNIYSMNIYNNSLPTTSFVESNGKIFYGLSVNKVTNEVYVTDAIDYIQQGTVYRYYENGNLIDSFKTGIIPQEILF